MTQRPLIFFPFFVACVDFFFLPYHLSASDVVRLPRVVICNNIPTPRLLTPIDNISHSGMSGGGRLAFPSVVHLGIF